MALKFHCFKLCVPLIFGYLTAKNRIFAVSRILNQNHWRSKIDDGLKTLDEFIPMIFPIETSIFVHGFSPMRTTFFLPVMWVMCLHFYTAPGEGFGNGAWPTTFDRCELRQPAHGAAEGGAVPAGTAGTGRVAEGFGLDQHGSTNEYSLVN